MHILIYDSGIGCLSILKEIIKQKKHNDYFLYIDEEYFPLGNKSSEQIQIHACSLLKEWEQSNYDLIILACNTMGQYFTKLNCKIPVLSILNYNLKNKPINSTFLGTPNLIKKLRCKSKKSGKQLATYIEKGEYKNIINCIKSFKFKSEIVILGCTHYPLVREIFEKIYPNITFCSFEQNLVNDIEDSFDLSFAGNKKGELILKQYHII